MINAPKIATLRNFIACADTLIAEFSQLSRMPARAQAALDQIKHQRSDADAALSAIESAREGALVVCEGGVIQHVLTTGAVDVLTVDYLENESDCISPTDVRILCEDGTWTKTEVAEVSLHGNAPGSPKSAAIVRSRVEEFKRSDGRSC